MSEHVWDGVTRAESLKEPDVATRHQLADAAKAADWQAMLALLDQHGQLINSTRPDGGALYSVLHQAAYGGAPIAVVEELVRRGAWRTLRSAQGERPSAIAARRGHTHLRSLLEPVLQHVVPLAALQLIQQHFHGLIRERATDLVREHALRLPELEPLLEMTAPKLWFAVPGMYGGFRFWLDQIAGDAVLVSESWCRVVEGSGQRHVISAHGSLLVAEGFV